MISNNNCINTLLIFIALIPGVSQGKLTDSSVESLRYASGKERGLIKYAGLISNVKGKTTTFSISGIELGMETSTVSPVQTVSSIDKSSDENLLLAAQSLRGNQSSKDSIEETKVYLKKLLLTLLDGTYTGTFSGGDTGIWSLTITTDGVDAAIRGYANNSSGSQKRMFKGNVASNGKISTNDSAWEAEVDVTTGKIFGTWTDNENGRSLSGVFSGSITQ